MRILTSGKRSTVLPALRDELMVFPAVVALQLVAFYVSRDKGLDVDKPRNLAKVVTVDGESISLTPIEYNILKLLLSHPGQVFSSAQIYEQVWNDPAYGSENTVAVHIRHLREKIEINPAEPRYLKVVWGLGYKMEKGAGG